jgi:hypothetical protein
VNRVLLLHPDDEISSATEHDYRLVVDLGRAPASTYEEWSRETGCPAMSLFELAGETEDLHRTRELLEYGMGEVIDRFGFDWWDVLVQSIVPQIQQLILLRRLAAMIEGGTEVYCTRPHFLATALQAMAGSKLVILQTRSQRVLRAASHYVNAIQQVDLAQFTQVLQDKFDPEHAVRRRLVGRRQCSSRPVVLLPSAYINVSRTAVEYAAMLPDVAFLLVHARNNGRLQKLPKNVQASSLNGYFSAPDNTELSTLRQAFRRLRLRLKSSAPEFEMAEVSGLLATMESRLGWGLAVRDAWRALFESETITACLCADDSNPYSRLPLMLAKIRGIPALACHHGALDSRMAIKEQHADFYLAKSDMERDYLVGVCRVSTERVVSVSPGWSQGTEPSGITKEDPGWLVFFTEPYHALGWRTGEVYRDLLPRLVALGRTCGLQLVFKLHPFESARGHRRILRRYLGRKTSRAIRVIDGQAPPEMWQHATCALTVQSSVAMECSRRGIPVFLCGWLADLCAAYVRQFERFGFGHILRTPPELDEVPHLMVSAKRPQDSAFEALSPEIFLQLLEGTHSRAALASA